MVLMKKSKQSLKLQLVGCMVICLDCHYSIHVEIREIYADVTNR